MVAFAASELRAIVERFLDAFNRADLTAAMAFFGEDAIYDEFDGKRHQGKEALARAFEPQFRGDFGAIRFETEDVFVDEGSGKVLLRWVCRVGGPRPGVWRGLDVIRFEQGLIAEKLTYAKTKFPLVDRTA